MTSRNAISLAMKSPENLPSSVIDGNMPLIEALHRLLDAPGRRLGVTDDSKMIGVIDESSMLEALGRQISPRYDSSVIEIRCAAGDFSASLIARAVEDADVHLVDMLTNPDENGYLRVTLRVRCDDPSNAVHSLERYGFDVVDSYGNSDTIPVVALDRLLGLQAFISV